MSASKTRLAWYVTERERDALLALEARRAAWKTFSRPTWLSLAAKSLVTFDGKPALTGAGRAAIALTRALTALTCKQTLEGKS